MIKGLKEAYRWFRIRLLMFRIHLEHAGEWCIDRLPVFLIYFALVLAGAVVFTQVGIYKGRTLQSAEVARLRREVAVLKGGIGELTGLLQDKCLAAWRGEEDETAIRKD